MTTTRRRRIALYGGTFDPVHVGHIAVARNLSELFALDEVLFIPAHVAPHKRSATVSPALHRHAMLALATQHEARLRISTVELDAPEKPYTVDTLARFQSETGAAARLFFIMGADSWEEIATWREWERVLTMTDQLIVTRPGYALTARHVSESIRERMVDVRGASREVVAREVEAAGGRCENISDRCGDRRCLVNRGSTRRACEGGGFVRVGCAPGGRLHQKIQALQ